MSKIRFYIPKSETIPTNLRLYVGNVYVEYERIVGGFLFYVFLDDEDKALNVVREIIAKIKHEHDESQHDVSWRDASLEIVPQETRYKIATIIKWTYRLQDSY